MLWGHIDETGDLYAALGFGVKGERLPAHVNLNDLSLDLAEEHFSFQRVGHGTVNLEETTEGWKGRRRHGFLRNLKGDILVGPDALLFINPSLDALRRGKGFTWTKPYMPFQQSLPCFCLVRKSEVRGWHRTRKGLHLVLVATTEVQLVPTAKALFTLTRGEPATGEALKAFGSSEIPNLAGLDKMVDVGLPVPSVLQRRFSIILIFPGVAIAASVILLAVGNRLDDPAGRNLLFFFAVGLLVMSISAVGIAGTLFRGKFRQNRNALNSALWRRTTMFFLENQRDLAAQFVSFSGRHGVALDYGLQSLFRLPEIEPLLRRVETWLPSAYRYAAYLGEVFARDVRARMQTSWGVGSDDVELLLPDIGLSFDVVGYVQRRMGESEILPPSAQFHLWETEAFLLQASQPVDLFCRTGILGEAEARSSTALAELVRDFSRWEGKRVARPFGTFIVRRKAVGGGLFLEYKALVRQSGMIEFDEPRAFGPVLEIPTVQRCTILESRELPLGVEAILGLDLGGEPGQPLVVHALLTNYLDLPAGVLSIGQLADVAVTGIAQSGEFLPPSDYALINPQDRKLVGFASPESQLGAATPQYRVGGTLLNSVPLASEETLVPLSLLTIDIHGIPLRVLADLTSMGGVAVPGNGFKGKVWWQVIVSARLVSAKAAQDPSVR